MPEKKSAAVEDLLDLSLADDGVGKDAPAHPPRFLIYPDWGIECACHTSPLEALLIERLLNARYTRQIPLSRRMEDGRGSRPNGHRRQEERLQE